MLIPTTTLEAHNGLAANFPYSQTIGLVMYLAMGIQPDLAFSVGLVLRFARNLGEVHVKAVKKILCYLLATTNIVLTFSGSGNQ